MNRNEITAMIKEVAAEYGVPAEFMLKAAQIESNFDPSAKNPRSSAGGLFQQIDSNAKEFGVANRFDPRQSAVGAAKFARQNMARFAKKGIPATPANLYLAHQQGGGGAVKILSNPNASAESLVGKAAVRLNGGKPGMTAGEFANIWGRKMGRKLQMPASVPSGPAPGASTTPPGVLSLPNTPPIQPDQVNGVLAAIMAEQQKKPTLVDALSSLGGMGQQQAPQAPPAPLPAQAPPDAFKMQKSDYGKSLMALLMGGAA